MKFIIITIITVLLSGCTPNVAKLNEFKFAPLEKQLTFELIGMCQSKFDSNYCKLLENDDVVYFDTSLSNEIIINPTDEESKKERDLTVAFNYSLYNSDLDNQLGDEDYSLLQAIKEASEAGYKAMKTLGLGNNFIYVIQDANGDLIYRATNGTVDYNYFDSREAKKIYDERLGDDSTK